MKLTKFDLVNTEGLKGLHYKGDFLAFDQITDELAEELMGKTHVLQRREEAPGRKASAAEAEAAPDRNEKKAK